MRVLKRPEIIVMLVLILLIATAAIRSIKNDKVPGNYNYLTQDIVLDDDPDAKDILLYGDKTVGQLFRSSFNGLSRIEVYLSVSSDISSKEIILHLKPSPLSRSDIAIARVNTRALIEKDSALFDFPKIAGSKNAQYYFYIEVPGTTPKDKIMVRYTYHKYADANPKGPMFVNGFKTDGHLLFETFCSLRENPARIVQDLIGLLLKDIPFLIFYVTLLFIVSVGCVYLFLKGSNNAQ